MKTELNRVPPRGGVVDAICYALARWNALCGFLDDGRIELDNNTVERAARPFRPRLARTTCSPDLMAARRWAIVASLVVTAKLNERRANHPSI